MVATTQMQPTDARKAFPCFDEPALKAIFHMTLIHDRNTVALANGMEIGESDRKQLYDYTFLSCFGSIVLCTVTPNQTLNTGEIPWEVDFLSHINSVKNTK